MSASDPPALVVVVDTEEEFDWTAGFDRNATGVAAIDEIVRFQSLCDAYGIRPAYVVDHPVATQPRGFEPLAAIAASGRAEIGVHVHPWVTPPFEETPCPRHSYPGNLPRELEKAKIETTLDAVERNVGVRARLYKAGRYGYGPHTAALLRELGFEVDASFCPGFDFRADGGPSYLFESDEPRWLDVAGGLLELPMTAGFVGACDRVGPRASRLLDGPSARRWRVPAILSRLRLLDRLALSPEGYDDGELERLTRARLDRGRRALVFSLHSPSLLPGATPYARSIAERDGLVERCRRYFELALGRLGVVATTPSDLRRRLASAEGAP